VTTILGSVALGIAALMIVTWLVSLPLHNASIVDLIWGLGFVVTAWVAYLTTPVATTTAHMVALLVMVTVWGLRLSGYLAWRNIGKGEDFRYVAMRKKYGNPFPIISLFVVFGLQGVLMWLVSLPVQAGMGADEPLGVLAWLGMVAWAVGVFFETTGDLQLARFKANPENKGKVMDRGLWRYTRHPNYFGDFMVWWGLYLVALDTGAWWSVIGPIVMTALLMKYSGAGLLEKTITKRRPGYDEYIRRTNSFFPGPPKAS
jgi:steroid 5-alpha reductase family enzyme